MPLNKIISEKIRESFQSVLPVSVIILILCFILGFPASEILEFSFGAFMLVVGLILFSIGASASMMKLAEEIGRYITKKQKLWFLIVVTFLVGFMIIFAEPSVWVLADQFEAIPSSIFVLAIAFGAAIFLVFALIRILFQIPIRMLFLIGYILVIAVGLFVQSVRPDYIPVAFDSGGATTGPIAVPFIIALGLGVARTRSDDESYEDSFGLVGLTIMGPILSVLVLGLIWGSGYGEESASATLIEYLRRFLIQVGISVIPFLILFLVFGVILEKHSRKKNIRTLIGFLFTYVGLVLYLTGANAGFVSIGKRLGESIAMSENNWILIPLIMMLGFTIVAAEPAVMVLNKQVEDVTGGAISKKFMLFSMSLGVAIVCGLSMIRVLTGLSIWWVILPYYLLSMILTFFSPKIFTSIALDSGAAASGAITPAFLMPLVLGASSVIEGGNPLTDAFGLIAFISMSPLVTIQVLGMLSARKERKAAPTPETPVSETIINLREVENENSDNHR